MARSIPVPAVRYIQRYLAGNNPANREYYDGAIDGLRGPKTHRAARAAIKDRVQALRADDRDQWDTGWSDKRRTIAVFQIIANDEARKNPDKFSEAGDVDGWWGPQTDAAYLSLTGKLQKIFDDAANRPPSNHFVPNPHNFPLYTEDALTDYYGPPCQIPLTRVEVPFKVKMKLAWNKAVEINTISIHSKLAESLSRILHEVDDEYSAREMIDLGLNLFGGSNNCRKMRGSNRWSTHAWGIAIDLDPERNRLPWGPERARLAQPDAEPLWRAFEKEGWRSQGRRKGNDFMHAQAALYTL